MGKKIIEVPKGMTREELDTFIKVSSDPFLFSTFTKIIHPVQGKLDFNLYPYQKRVLYYFLKERFNIVLKFRQAGLTELISMYCLWLALYHQNKNIQIISIKDRVAKKVLRRIKYMYRNLPWYLKVPVVNGRPGDIGCVTKDTVLIGDKYDFKIGDITPNIKGVTDISNLNLKVLTHTGKFERILKSVNKGELETYHIENSFGKKLSCTWNHKLLTTSGWQFVEDIITKGLNCIFWDTDYLNDLSPKITIPPKKEIIKETKFKGYYVSNLGSVYTKNHLKRKSPDTFYRMSTRIMGHERVKLKGEGNNRWYSVHRLVYETFKGDIPDGLIVDHIDEIRTHNYITNLQCITYSENTKKSYTSNRVLVNNNYVLENVDFEKLGKIKELSDELGEGYGTGSIIAKKLGLTTKEVSRYRRKLTGGNLYISKVKLNSITTETIVDLEVENSHSYITKSEYVNHNTASELEFSNGSLITSIPTTEEAGRSEAVSLLVIDEAAIVRWAQQIWAAAFPTLSTGGSAILNSTPYGVGNLFHKTWVDAVAKGNNFNPVRLYWRMHPDRDDNWYRVMSEALGPRRTAQEIDGDFLTSGNSVFDLLDIKAIEDSLSEIEPFNVLMNGRLVEVFSPKRGVNYYLSADVASGRSRDYSAFSLMNRPGVEHAYFKGKIPVAQLSKLLMKEGKKYNNAIIAPESNDIGLAVTTSIQEHGYPNLYYTTRFLKEKGKSKPKIEKVPGWYTTVKNRSIIIDELEEAVRNDTIETYDRFFVQEAYTFIYDESNRPVAMGKDGGKSDGDHLEDEDGKYSDDSILAKAINNHIRKGKVTSAAIGPK